MHHPNLATHLLRDLQPEHPVPLRRLTKIPSDKISTVGIDRRKMERAHR